MSAKIMSVLPCVCVLFSMSGIEMSAARSEKGFLDNNKKQAHFAATSALGFLNSKQDNQKQIDFAPKPSVRLERDVADFANRNEKPLQCQYRFSGSKAECNGDQRGGRRFTYIPLLPKYITSLSFQSNDLYSIADKTFFANVTQLIELDLSSNNITSVASGVFGLMSKLRRLFIDQNPLQTLSSLRNILATRSLFYVSAHFCRFPSFTKRFLADVDISYVEELDLVGNHMDRTLNLSPLCRLKQLDILNLYQNGITTIKTNCALEALTWIYLDFNNLVEFFPSCDPDGNSYFPELVYLSVAVNKITGIYVDVCMPKLERLIMQGNLLGLNNVYDVFDALHFPALKELSLDENNHLSHNGLGQSFFRNSPVQTLSLSGNLLDFGRSVDTDTFFSCPNISELTLDNNVFSSVIDLKFQDLFGHLPLVKLSLKQTQFTAVSPETFRGLTQLEELQLCCNKIVYIPDGTFDHLVSLRYLDLSENQIKTIGPRTFSDRVRENLRGLCAQSNPFVCSCDLVWFQSWLRSHSDLTSPTHFRCIHPRYVCSDRPLTAVPEFVIPEQACLMSQEVGGYIITFCTTVTVTLTTFLLLFTYRWHLRLLLYEAFRGRDEGARRRRLLQNNFDYDVFVSYDSEDSNWVKQRLMPELEGRLGLKLCIHERDFTLGRNIVDNIGECVESSKKVLMVFSNNFVFSQWCQFELTYCLRHVMDYDDVLLIVCVDDVTNREMTTAMMAVLKTTTYIQWAGYDDAIRAFWGRLRIALREITDLEQRV